MAAERCWQSGCPPAICHVTSGFSSAFPHRRASLWPFLAFSSSLSQGHRMGRTGGGYRSSPSSPCSHHLPFPLPTAFSLTGPAWLQSTNSSQEAKNIQTNIPTAHSASLLKHPTVRSLDGPILPVLRCGSVLHQLPASKSSGLSS